MPRVRYHRTGTDPPGPYSARGGWDSDYDYDDSEDSYLYESDHSPVSYTNRPTYEEEEARRETRLDPDSSDALPANPRYIFMYTSSTTPRHTVSSMTGSQS